VIVERWLCGTMVPVIVKEVIRIIVMIVFLVDVNVTTDTSTLIHTIHHYLIQIYLKVMKGKIGNGWMVIKLIGVILMNKVGNTPVLNIGMRKMGGK
jgi:hypothetical protein